MKKRKFKSFIALQLDEFVLYQLSSGIWIKGPDYNLFNFDAFLYREYRNGTVLTEEMLKWCKCRVSEKLSTCYKRTHGILSNSRTLKAGQICALKESENGNLAPMSLISLQRKN